MEEKILNTDDKSDYTKWMQVMVRLLCVCVCVCAMYVFSLKCHVKYCCTEQHLLNSKSKF